MNGIESIQAYDLHSYIEEQCMDELNTLNNSFLGHTYVVIWGSSAMILVIVVSVLGCIAIIIGYVSLSSYVHLLI